MFSNAVTRFEEDRVSSRDAAHGLGLIADALDHGLETLDEPIHSRFWLGDAIAIGLGWLLLVAVILYPALQLLAIGAGIIYLGAKSFMRLLLGPDMAQVRNRNAPSARARQKFLTT